MNVDQTSYPPGSRILARDEEWLVRSAAMTDRDGFLIRATGVTEFVQGVDATFFTGIEHVEVLRPENTVLVGDNTPHFRRSRLFLEAVLRRTPLPRSAKGLALADNFLLDPLSYQLRPAETVLAAERPRLLLADVVGLGKTLEIGLTLGELIRRGRGERILVVTPQHILEQFQHELWTRFSIPLVRLDSVGIERIQREIPAGRNPFTYFKRVIVSIDTLKNVGMYGHHLDKTDWDAVVIDESHNLIGQTSLRNRLARRLAVQTDALLLASATPHGGDKKAFAGLIHMLDPAAISNVDSYQTADIEHLYLRRTKISSEVRDQIGDRWAKRTPPQPIHCPANPAEEEVFAELTGQWLTGVAGRDHLFAYTLAEGVPVVTHGARRDRPSSTHPEHQVVGRGRTKRVEATRRPCLPPSSEPGRPNSTRFSTSYVLSGSSPAAIRGQWCSPNGWPQSPGCRGGFRSSWASPKRRYG